MDSLATYLVFDFEILVCVRKAVARHDGRDLNEEDVQNRIQIQRRLQRMRQSPADAQIKLAGESFTIRSPRKRGVAERVALFERTIRARGCYVSYLLTLAPMHNNFRARVRPGRKTP